MSKNNESMFIRLPNHFQEIAKANTDLNDCILRAGEKQIPCQRVFLARYSKWFYKYFLEHQKIDKNPVVVEINNVEPKYLEEFINLLYTNYLKVNEKNLPQLLKIAYYYKFPHISHILRSFCIDANTQNKDKFLMQFTEKFIEAGLIDDAISLAPKIAAHFRRAELHDPSEKITIQEIYQKLNPAVFSAVLKARNRLLSEEQMKNPQKTPTYSSTQKKNNNIKLITINDSIRQNLSRHLYDQELTGNLLIIYYIEQFVKTKGISTLTETDKKQLSEVLKTPELPKGIEDDYSINYMKKFSCEWFPDKIYRKHVCTLLDKKREILNNFEKKVDLIDQKTGTNRWFIMSWIKKIKDVKMGLNDVPLIEFIRTLGDSTNEINPILYNLIKVECSKPLMMFRGIENAFLRDPNLYYITGIMNQDKNELPFVDINLGENVFFRPRRILLDSRASYNSTDLNARSGDNVLDNDYMSHASLLNLKTSSVNNLLLKIPNPRFPSFVLFPRENGDDDYAAPLSSVRLELNKNDKNTDTFRITTIEITGTFDPIK